MRERHRGRQSSAPERALPSPNRTLRASDQDRESVIQQLGEHAAAGRLTLAEFEERVSAVSQARLLSDLDAQLSDLPATASGGGSPVRRAIWRTGPWGSWLVTAMICLGIWAVTSIGQAELLYFWPIWVIGPWGVAILWRTLTCARPAG